MAETEVATRKDAALKLNFFSHATIDTSDIARSRKFYEEFMGFDVVQTSQISLLIRLGGNTSIAVVQTKKPLTMHMMNHNGLDVATQADVDAAYAVVEAEKEKWGLHKISKPALQHGTYSFYFWDCDDNAWEILSNPPGGYSWLFERGDQEGRGHLDKKFARPDSTKT